MQVIPRCRSLLISRNSLNFSSTQFASFHSTPIFYDKRKHNPKSNAARFAIRQKRADTKKALNHLLSHYGDRGTTFANHEFSKLPGIKNCDAGSTNKRRPKSESKHTEKIHNHRMRRKYRKSSFPEDDDVDPETVFRANFGGKWYTWSFDSGNGTSRRSSPRFDWRESLGSTNGCQGEWDRAHETDSEDERCNVGLPADRVLLGLSPKGPLKMKDVKTAFHSSALKWHPDKHQGPTQAQAEEKFKLCVSAYNSLCSALSGH